MFLVLYAEISFHIETILSLSPLTICRYVCQDADPLTGTLCIVCVSNHSLPHTFRRHVPITNTSYTFTMWDINEWSVLLVMLQFWPTLRVIMGGCVYEFESDDLCHDQRVLWWGNSCGWQNKLENLAVARYCKIQQLENSEIKTIIMLMVQSNVASDHVIQ